MAIFAWVCADISSDHSDFSNKSNLKRHQHRNMLPSQSKEWHVYRTFLLHANYAHHTREHSFSNYVSVHVSSDSSVRWMIQREEHPYTCDECHKQHVAGILTLPLRMHWCLIRSLITEWSMKLITSTCIWTLLTAHELFNIQSSW
jgi:hypothetical protein